MKKPIKRKPAKKPQKNVMPRRRAVKRKGY